MAPPTGNYGDPSLKNHINEDKTGDRPGITIHTVDNVQELSDKLVIRPTLDWYVKNAHFLHTDIVQRELEHVSRWLWWHSNDGAQSNWGDGAKAVRDFNANPTGLQGLIKKIDAADYNESEWQRQNIHGDTLRHNLDRHPEKQVYPGVNQNLIENVRPNEEPYLGH